MEVIQDLTGIQPPVLPGIEALELWTRNSLSGEAPSEVLNTLSLVVFEVKGGGFGNGFDLRLE